MRKKKKSLNTIINLASRNYYKDNKDLEFSIWLAVPTNTVRTGDSTLNTNSSIPIFNQFEVQLYYIPSIVSLHLHFFKEWYNFDDGKIVAKLSFEPQIK